MPDYTVEAIIEDVDTKRFKNAGVRFRVLLSLPVNGNEQLYLAATKNIGNVIEAGLTIIQGELLPLEDEDESDAEAVFSGEMAYGELGDSGAGDTEGSNALADKLIEDAQADRRDVDPDEAAQAEANIASRSNGRGRNLAGQPRE